MHWTVGAPREALFAAQLIEALVSTLARAPAPDLPLVALYKRALRRGITARDCIGLTWLGAGLLLTYHLWVVAGLPGTGMPS